MPSRVRRRERPRSSRRCARRSTVVRRLHPHQRDPRHRPGVERLWRACAARGDIYQRDYRACTASAASSSTRRRAGRRPLPRARTPPELVEEENWFFRLSRYQDAAARAASSRPAADRAGDRRNEVLGFVARRPRRLQRLALARAGARLGHPGARRPGAGRSTSGSTRWPTTSPRSTTATDGDRYRRWWARARERVHVIGKGIIRFHAVYWPAMLLSAGVLLPTDIFVHGYLTVDGQKCRSRSARDRPHRARRSATGATPPLVVPARRPASRATPTSARRCSRPE